MAKIKIQKMVTPGTKPTGLGVSPGRRRPKKTKAETGTSRKGNYKMKYTLEGEPGYPGCEGRLGMHLRYFILFAIFQRGQH